jgi:creatinine amidohydrolase
MRPWVLSEVNYGTIKGNPYEVAVLPMGATEPHNLHLPYGTDMYEGTDIGESACAYAHARGAKVVVLPTIPYGTETNMRKFPLAMNLYPTTLFKVIEDLVESLVRSGIRKIVILNSHGGNDFKPLLREMSGRTEAHLFLANWYNMLDDVYHDIFEHMEDHAGEAETSLILAYHNELVSRNEDGSFNADDGKTNPTRFDAVNKKWVSITRQWDLLTSNSGSGYPHAATAEKGERLMEVLTERIGDFLVELSNSELDESFPF